MIGRMRAWSDSDLANAMAAAELIAGKGRDKGKLTVIIAQQLLLIDAVEQLAVRSGLGPDLCPHPNAKDAWESVGVVQEQPAGPVGG